MYSLIYFSDDELRQARNLRFILLNMDFKSLEDNSFKFIDCTNFSSGDVWKTSLC